MCGQREVDALQKILRCPLVFHRLIIWRVSVNTVCRVLSIGTEALSSMTYERCLKEQGHALAVAYGYKDLFQTEMNEGCEVAVLHHTLSQEELIEAAHFIRRRWPAARILIVRPKEWWIDDALYDDRVLPDANPELLLSAVERLASLVMRPTAECQAESGQAA